MAQQEKPFIPPPRKPVQEFFTPTPTAVFYTELVNRDDPAYQAVTPITRGSLYSSISGGNQSVTDKYPNLYFLRESRYANSDQLVLWTWANDPVAESSYNSEVSYFLEDVSTPTFTRVYTIRRDVYDNSTPTARGTALSAIIGVKITAAGEDYTFATGTVGNATVVFVCGNGQILSGIVTNEGSGITNNATIVIQGDGANGAAKAIVQPITATLISEGKKEFPENHPLRNEYVQVVRVYRNPTGPVLTDQQYDQTLDVAVPSTRQEVAVASAGVGTNRRDIKGIDTVRSEVVTFDPAALAAVFDNYLLYFPGTAHIELPDILESVVGYMSKGSGDGTDDTTGTGTGSGPTWFYQFSSRGRSQSSGSIVPQVTIGIKQYWARNVPTTVYFFFMASPVTAAAFLAKLLALTGSAVTAWPKFIPTAHSVILQGSKVSIELSSQLQGSASHNADGGSAVSSAIGGGVSQDHSTSIRAVRIPPTIHGDIAITGVVSDFAGTVGATGLIETGYVNGAGVPYLPATTPSSVPTSGLYLLRSQVEPYRFGYARCVAEVVDMADVT